MDETKDDITVELIDVVVPIPITTKMNTAKVIQRVKQGVNMGETTVQGLVEGGKATSGPPFGPALGPLGVNINAIVAEINEKTKQFAGIKIPVKVHVDSATKTFRVEIGAPTTSAMLLKELGIAAGAKGKGEIVGNITLDKVKR